MLIEKDNSGLIIIDVQEKLVTAMPKPHKFIDNIIKLQKAAKILDIPVTISEQYPEGLGSTIDKIQKNRSKYTHFCDKTFFSHYQDPHGSVNKPTRDHIICGIEAHICVLQTAIDYAENKEQKKYVGWTPEKKNNNVYVVGDATSSRYEKDYLTALSRLDKHPNIQIVTCEMVLFEWLRTSDHPEFKTISQLIK